MTPQQLRSSILQMAIEGKLTEQRAEDGKAADLLKEIQAEKARLIAEGKIKKEKPLPKIGEDEVPFEIPGNWCWCRLKDVVYNRGQKKPNKAFCYIDIGSIDNISQKLSVEDNIIEADKAPSRARKIVDIGDILYSTVRPYLHNMCIVNRTFSFEPIASTGFAALTCFRGMFNKYLFYYLLSPEFDAYANSTENAKGVAYPAINDGQLYKAVVPLPPLAEQHRIVAKLEQILPQVAVYEKAHNELRELNRQFPVNLKNSLLQMAIEGKLTEQRAEDGKAADLLKEIRAEKARLIAEGKIKKDKPLPKLGEDEVPFEIPGNWCWCRLGEILQIINGDRGKNYPAKSTLKVVGDIPFISAGNISGNSISSNGLLYMSKRQYELLSQGHLIKGDLVLCIRGSLGKNGVYPFEIGAIASSLVILRGYYQNTISYNYVSMYFDSSLFMDEIHQYDNGTAQPNLGARDLAKFLIPLPPLAEQHRIVAKLEQLLPLCDTLAQTAEQ